jgi:hypothetical protein
MHISTKLDFLKLFDSLGPESKRWWFVALLAKRLTILGLNYDFSLHLLFCHKSSGMFYW